MEFVLINSFTLPCQYIPQIMFSLKISARVMTVTSSGIPELLPDKSQTKALFTGEEDRCSQTSPAYLQIRENLISSVHSIKLDLDRTFVYPFVFRMEKKL